MSEEIPKGRIARGLALVKLAGSQLPTVASRVLRGENASLDLEAVRLSAEKAASVLGELRGLAMKIGQTASYVDGLLPPEASDVYQATLARLQSAAPTVSFEALQAEIERGLGRPLAEMYVRFDPEPLASASIGQVHRAAIRAESGELVEVAVKVQYPSVAQAVTSDLKNIEALKPMLALLAPGADTSGGVDEVVSTLREELDYTTEARNQRRFRALAERFAHTHVAHVFDSHTARNVLTMEFVEGRPLREVCADGDQALRNKVGEAIFRFTMGLAIARGVFNTDPHPGNYLVQPDGTVTFLDFGSVKQLPADIHQRWRELVELLLDNKFEVWRQRHADLFGLGHMDPRALEHHLKFMWTTASMVAPDEEVTIDRTMLRGTFEHGMNTARAIGRDVGWMPSRARTVAMPPDFVMAGRMQLGLFAVLAHLRPRANWHRILREMLDQDYADL